MPDADNIPASVITALQEDWQLQSSPAVTKEQLLAALSRRLTVVAAQNPEYFFQLMYRLDIPEKLLQEALQQAEAADKVAMLVLQRQMQKWESRVKNSLNRPDIDDALAW